MCGITGWISYERDLTTERATLEALAEVPHLAGESGHEQRMREISYLHLTRFLQLKSPYPSTQDPRYTDELRNELKQLLDDADSPVLALVNAAAARAAADGGGDGVRSGAELVLGLDAWLRAYDVELDL